MKTSHLLSLTVILSYSLPSLSTGEPTTRDSGTMRDTTTHDQLSQKLRMAQQADPIRKIGPAIGNVDVDPSVTEAPRDLIKESTILCFRGALTLVPKRAVLHLPKNLEDRFEAQPNVKVQTWPEFFLANRGWIRTIEVTRAQAMGEEAMPEKVVESFRTSTAVIVATFKGGPISVLPVQASTGEDAPENDSANLTATSTNPSATKP